LLSGRPLFIGSGHVHPVGGSVHGHEGAHQASHQEAVPGANVIKLFISP